MDPNEEIVEKLRALFEPAAAKLTPDVEPAFRYAWRDASPEPEPNDTA